MLQLCPRVPEGLTDSRRSQLPPTDRNYHVLGKPTHSSLSVTFENWADFPPYGNASASVVLAQCKLHVEEQDTPQNGHGGVGDKERP